MIRNSTEPMRLCRWHYETALDVIECARDVNDALVISACAQILESYRLARRVPREILELMLAFAAD